MRLNICAFENIYCIPIPFSPKSNYNNRHVCAHRSDYWCENLWLIFFNNRNFRTTHKMIGSLVQLSLLRHKYNRDKSIQTNTENATGPDCDTDNRKDLKKINKKKKTERNDSSVVFGLFHMFLIGSTRCPAPHPEMLIDDCHCFFNGTIKTLQRSLSIYR